MAHTKFNKDWPTVICETGMHLIVMPNGDHLKGLIMTRVTDDDGDFPQVLLKAFCNIAKDHEDAMRKYKEAEEEEMIITSNRMHSDK